MRELNPKGWRGSQVAAVLAGVLWICAGHLGAAQRVSLILEPPNPQEGQDVTLAVRGGPQRFTQCEWFRNTPQKREHERIVEYFPGQSPQQKDGPAHSGREKVRADCSLQITNLRQSDTGNYSVIIENVPSRQEVDQQRDAIYEGSVYLEVSASTQITIPVRSVPQHPNQGEEVTLTPQGTPHEIVFCEWLKEGTSGNIQTIIQYEPREQQSPLSGDTNKHERVTVRSDCSLRMTKLTTADSGTYTVKMEVLPDRQQQQPGQGNQPQEPEGIQKYWGQVDLKVNQASGQGQQKGASASLRYSSAIVVGALLLFFAWTDTFTSYFRVLCYSPTE